MISFKKLDCIQPIDQQENIFQSFNKSKANLALQLRFGKRPHSKSGKIVLKELCVSLSTSQIWENRSSLKLIGSVLNKTHVPDFPDSASFAQNLNRKTVTSYSSEFLSWRF